MNLWKSPSGSYHIWLNRSEHPPNGKRFSLKRIAGHTVYDKTEAKAYLRELRKTWHKQKIIDLQTGSRHPIGKFKDKYIEERSHLSESTLRMDDMSLRFFIEVVGEHLSIELIRKKHINQFISFLKGRDVTPKSINSYLRHVRAAYNTACELYDIKSVKFKLLKVSRTLPKILTKDELDKILTYAKMHDYEMWRIILFAINTGCRRAEIRNLKWQDVSGDIVTVIGKGNRTRHVPLQDGAREALGTIFDVGPIFSQIHIDGYSKGFKTISDSVGVSAKFHNLRHSAATYMIQSGMNPRHVQDILGHEDFRTTELYINLNKDWLVEEIQKFKI
jgi:integrase